MKGNFLIGLFMLVVILTVFSALIPIITTQISSALPFLSTAERTIISLIPLAVIVVILSMAITGKMDS